MTSLTSRLLIASPDLENDFFSESVIFILEHSQSKGAAGIVLNKPSEVPLERVLSELDDATIVQENELMNIGGPCEGPVVAFHACAECAEVPLLPGVAMAVKPNNLKRLIQSEYDVRMFSGYSGWAPGQLETEIKSGGWYSTEASADLIFGDPMDLWRRACDQYGNEIIFDLVDGKLPSNPRVN